MCGIVGYVGPKPAAPVLIQGLRDLEYRGYDSAGIAVLENGEGIRTVKREGKLANLESALACTDPLKGTVGIGHTRWATHGPPTDRNAHPHAGYGGSAIIVHNGIVENYAGLQRELDGQGVERVSDTDSEIIAHLVEREMDGGVDLLEAVRRTCARLQGSQAILAMSSREPGVLVAARLGNAGGIVIGRSEGEQFISSDLASILPHTQKVSYLADGELVRIDQESVRFIDEQGEGREVAINTVAFDPISALKGQYPHFMLKEIMEQPESLADTIQSLITIEPPDIRLTAMGDALDRLATIERAVFIGMGTSSYAAMLGRHYLEHFAGIPSELNNASEFRYRAPVIDDKTLVVTVSQSGETVDVLEAMAVAKQAGALLVTICNMEGAQTTRVAHGTVYTRTGVERAVASTKTYTASVAAMYCLALEAGRARGKLSAAELAEAVTELAQAPDAVGRFLRDVSGCQEAAQWLGAVTHMLVLGRGTALPTALELALKMKEISYVHAEGYPAGEMKHGPIALIDETCPTIAVATKHAQRDKMVSNIEQVRSRGGRVLGILTEGDDEVAARCDQVIFVPEVPALIEPIIAAIPAQCLAYHMAVRRGCDVDQPRNLAKTVTVE